MAPGEMTMIKRESSASCEAGRDGGAAAASASGGARTGGAEVQYSQQRCRTLSVSGAVPSAAGAPSDPWQMAPSESDAATVPAWAVATPRSEEHTSELQSLR